MSLFKKGQLLLIIYLLRREYHIQLVFPLLKISLKWVVFKKGKLLLIFDILNNIQFEFKTDSNGASQHCKVEHWLSVCENGCLGSTNNVGLPLYGVLYKYNMFTIINVNKIFNRYITSNTWRGIEVWSTVLSAHENCTLTQIF